MDYTNFSVRLDAETAEALRRLAEYWRRKRGDLVRWLIWREATQLKAVPPLDVHEVRHEPARGE